MYLYGSFLYGSTKLLVLALQVCFSFIVEVSRRFFAGTQNFGLKYCGLKKDLIVIPAYSNMIFARWDVINPYSS
jgi:hypothetical protein